MNLLASWKLLGVTLLLAASAFIASCAEQSAEPIAARGCGADVGRDALRDYVMKTSLARDTSPEGVTRLIEIMRYGSSLADEQVRAQFDDAIASLASLGGSKNLAGDSVAVIIKEVSDRGVSNDGSVLCWARIDVEPATAGMESLERLATALSSQYDLTLPAAPQITYLPIFYSISSSEPVRVVEADLAGRDAARIGGLIRLVQSAPIALAPIETQQARLRAYEKEVMEARGAVLSADLAEARYSLATSKNKLNELWAELDEGMRQKLSSRQSVWIKQRDARCNLTAKERATEENQRELIEVQCLANENERRVRELRQLATW